MRVRIVRQPLGHIHGIALKHYKPGQVYDLPPTLADYLVAADFAIFEMRNPDAPPRPVEVERRRSNS